MVAAGRRRVEFAVSDHADLSSLQRWLGWVPDITVTRVSGVPGVGDQGALDTLAVTAATTGLVAAARMLPEFLRSRRAGLSISTTVNGQAFTLDATNVADVMPILERLLDQDE